jgi:hypothetical protein
MLFYFMRTPRVKPLAGASAVLTLAGTAVMLSLNLAVPDHWSIPCTSARPLSCTSDRWRERCDDG